MKHLIEDQGFRVIKFDHVLPHIRSAVVSHINFREAVVSAKDRENIDSFDDVFRSHDFYKNKINRIFQKSTAERLSTLLIQWANDEGFDARFITDEESLGFPNIYFRAVRANSTIDVGPIHADRWFWDLGGMSFPDDHHRIKIWIPIVQNDDTPSLLILPKSHKENFNYAGTKGEDGKIRPVFYDARVFSMMERAPVKVGECIAFSDNLLHGGSSTSMDRISVEFTLAVKNS